MQWKDLDSDFWKILANRKSSHRSLVNTEELTGNNVLDCYLSIFVSQDKTYHLIISSDEREISKINDPKIAGLKIEILPNLFVTGRERQSYIDVRCSALPHLDAFTHVVKDISKDILDNNIEPHKAINQTIRKWKSFLSGSVNHILSESEQVGLFGELLILEFLIQRDILKSIRNWVGPDQAIHDFELPNYSIEIKTTLKMRHEHTINGVEQLDGMPNKNLYLVSILSQIDNVNGRSISKLKENITELLETAPEEYEQFMGKLSMAGYRQDHESYYDELKLTTADIRVFTVENEFPRIIRKSFIKQPAPNIFDITYKLNLEGRDFFSLEKLFPLIKK
jgi:hypothetical protein